MVEEGTCDAGSTGGGECGEIGEDGEGIQERAGRYVKEAMGGFILCNPVTSKKFHITNGMLGLPCSNFAYREMLRRGMFCMFFTDV
jgi:hypothetical protein